MDREHFRDILNRYLQGRATAEEVRLIDSWYAEMESGDDDEGAAPADLQVEERYWSAIREKMDKGRTRRMYPWRMVGVAASLLIAGVLVAYFAKHSVLDDRMSGARESLETDVQIISNETSQRQAYLLPDSSEVILEPHTEIRYTSAFNQKERAVSLKGAAFFKVSRDEHRPFLVHTNKLTTRVLGTSFRVEAFAGDRKVIVSVKTGRVSVYGTDEDESNIEEVVLTPNQKVVYDEVRHKISRMIVDSPQVIVPEEDLKRMRFEEAPVTEIFAAVEKVYGVDLEFDAETFSSCVLTSVISDGDLYSRLDIICNAIGASYHVRENAIAISGPGCSTTPQD